MKRFVWFELADREGKPVASADAVQLPSTGIVLEFQNALTNPTLYSNCSLHRTAGLNVYKDRVALRARHPLKSSIELGGLGAVEEEALIVEVPKIWYQLFAAGTLTAAASVPLIDSAPWSISDMHFHCRFRDFGPSTGMILNG
ncbi:hypothetical protein PHYPSEUDO_008295 [Phytophthora pseudosyringae]|uniref:Uncharacterized protein n=1 Tax=Phytophthora pseudosyringae TaxID=221518 RepID=A0A8T1VHE5_9STRA|nr:hypothetical protein PHYPSEUDO_008295 [Phytophthora pseudosyringae]